MQRLYIAFIKNRGHLVFLFTTFISLTFLLNNSDPNIIFVRAKFNDAFSFISYPSALLRSTLQLEEEVGYLREKNLQLSLQSHSMISAFDENIEFKKLLNFKKTSALNLIAAKVINSGAILNLSSITLNVGSNDGVTINRPVITPEGVIGKVIISGKKTSVVQLISDANFRLSVRIMPSGSMGILKFLSGNTCEIREIQKNSKISIGDRVVTSGFSVIYPSNLAVGEVIELHDELGSSQKVAKIKIFSNIGSLLYAFIITDDDGSSN